MQFVGSSLSEVHGDRVYRPDHRMVEKINQAQSSWKAVEYPHFHGMKLSEVSPICPCWPDDIDQCLWCPTGNHCCKGCDIMCVVNSLALLHSFAGATPHG